MSFFDDASLVMIPSGYKDQKVYSVKPTDGTGDLTFSRASSATRVASNGLIEKVRTNVLLQSETFDNASWSKSATGGGSAPVVTANNTTAPDGTLTADKIVFSAPISGDISSLSQTISLSTLANGSIYLKAFAAGDVGKTVGIRFNVNTFTILTLTADWQRYSLSQTATGVAFEIALRPFVGTSDGTVSLYAWGAQLETGDIATDYIATTTAAVSVGPVSGLPRLDYLGSTCGRLILEPQRTNLYPYSEQLNQWTASGSTVTANYAVSPDGYTNADRVQFTAGSVVFYSGTGSAGQNTLSVYAKATSGTSAQFRFFGNGATTLSSDQTATGEWQRFTFTYTYSAVTAGLAAPTTGGGVSDVIFYGFQHEVGSYATSYIPTLGASVTRVADAASKTGISSLIGQTEGTIFWEFAVDTPSATGHEGILNLDGGSFGNTIYIFKSSNALIVADVFVSSVNQATFTKSTITAGTYKCALGYANNNTAFFINGVQVGTTDTSCSVPAMSRIQLGNGVLGPSTDKTAQVLLFPTRLTNSQLAELTA